MWIFCFAGPIHRNEFKSHNLNCNKHTHTHTQLTPNYTHTRHENQTTNSSCLFFCMDEFICTGLENALDIRPPE